jgi:hypothetical protein
MARDGETVSTADRYIAIAFPSLVVKVINRTLSAQGQGVRTSSQSRLKAAHRQRWPEGQTYRQIARATGSRRMSTARAAGVQNLQKWKISGGSAHEEALASF